MSVTALAAFIDPALLVRIGWGVAGATIYAGPRWLACVYGTEGQFWRRHWRCTLEGGVSISVGALAAAAFAGWAMTIAKPLGGDLPAVAAMIGLIANPVAPKLAETLASRTANAIADKIAKRLNPPDKGDSDR